MIRYAMLAANRLIQPRADCAPSIALSFRRIRRFAGRVRVLLIRVIAKLYVRSTISTKRRPYVKNAPVIWIRQHATSAPIFSTPQLKNHV